LKSEIERLWAKGKHIVFDIDVKGATSIKQKYPEETLAVFVKPPTPEVLFERLRARGTESEKNLRKRIERAKEELAYENKFDVILVNDILEDTLQNAERLVRQFTSSR
jgi:guanylate kinase